MIDPTTRAGTDLLLLLVWGPTQLRRRIRPLARPFATVTGALAAGGFMGAAFNTALGLIVTGGLALAGGFLGWLKPTRPKRPTKRAHDRPWGAGAGASPWSHPPLRAVIADGPVTVSPVTNEACVAFALELVHRAAEGGERMLYDAATIGFEFTTADGRRGRVPIGRIRLTGVGVEVAAPDVARTVKSIVASQDLDAEPFPWTQALEARLLPGDRIEILSPLEEVLDLEAPPGLYRDRAATVLVPRGVPVCRRDGTMEEEAS